MNSLRVLLVTPRYLPIVGGVQNHVYQIARRFAQRDLETTVLTTNPGGQLAIEEKSEGLKIRRVPAWPALRQRLGRAAKRKVAEFQASAIVPRIERVYEFIVDTVPAASILRLIASEESTRQLFKSSSTGAVAPLWEQWVAIGSVMLIALGLPFGLSQIWKQYRQRLLALLLAVVAPVYLPMQIFRLTPAGWETSNRASEFLFVGIAFVLAVGTVQCWFSRRCKWIDRWVLAGCVVTLIFGGFIAGWPPKARF